MPKSLGQKPGSIRVRMYRVGFGDCFLISLPLTGNAYSHILVDCGVHSQGNIGTIQTAVDDVLAQTGGKLALVIATHAHQDHISGFASCEETFRRFTVGEVWLPWTEDPSDPDAVQLRTKQAALTQQIVEHFTIKPPSEEAQAAVTAALQNLTGNAEALRFLKSGMGGGKVRYLQAGQSLDDVAGISGLSARILGPPKSRDFLARMDPPASERFLRAAPDGTEEQVNAVFPFEPEKWGVKPAEHKYYQAITEKDKNLLAVAASNAEGLAFFLDNAMNNTSVVALFSYRGKQLLFPGDAQWGSWQSWLGDRDAAGLLADIHFYKVAHHGSHNATPKSAVAGMTTKAFAAMVSTQSTPWASIPQLKLIDAIQAKATAVLRSDSLHVKNAPDGPAVGKLTSDFAQGAIWFDYFLPVRG